MPSTPARAAAGGGSPVKPKFLASFFTRSASPEKLQQKHHHSPSKERASGAAGFDREVTRYSKGNAEGAAAERRRREVAQRENDRRGRKTSVGSSAIDSLADPSETVQQFISLPDGTNVMQFVPRGRKSKRHSGIMVNELKGGGTTPTSRRVLEAACKNIHEWDKLPSALQQLLLGAFEDNWVPAPPKDAPLTVSAAEEAAEGEDEERDELHIIIKERDPMTHMHVVLDGTFIVASSLVDGSLVLTEYIRGDTFNDAALYEADAISMVTIQCASPNGGRICSLKGDLFRKIKARTDTLNENIDPVSFLHSTGYYEDCADIYDAASEYELRTYHSIVELQRGLTEDAHLAAEMKQRQIRRRLFGLKHSFNKPRRTSEKQRSHSRQKRLSDASAVSATSFSNGRRLSDTSFSGRRLSDAGGASFGAASSHLGVMTADEDLLAASDEDQGFLRAHGNYTCLVKSGRLQITLSGSQRHRNSVVAAAQAAANGGESSSTSEQQRHGGGGGGGGSVPLITEEISFSLGPGDPIGLTALVSIVTDPASRVTLLTSRITIMLHPARIAHTLPIPLRRDMEKIYLQRLLEAMPVFSAEFSSREIAQLVNAATHISYPKGHKVFTRGVVGMRVLHVIYSGSASLLTSWEKARLIRRRSSAGDSFLRHNISHFLQHLEDIEEEQSLRRDSSAGDASSPEKHAVGGEQRLEEDEISFVRNARLQQEKRMEEGGHSRSDTNWQKNGGLFGGRRKSHDKDNSPNSSRDQLDGVGEATSAVLRSLDVSPNPSPALLRPPSAAPRDTSPSPLKNRGTPETAKGGSSPINGQHGGSPDGSRGETSPLNRARAGGRGGTSAAESASGDDEAVLQDLHVGDCFGIEGFLSLRTQGRSVPFKASNTLRVSSDSLHCLAFDEAACGGLLERMLFVFSRLHLSWRWAVANRTPVRFTDISIGKTLGIGSFGIVRLAVHSEGGHFQKETSTAYALKRVPRSRLTNARIVTMLQRERELLAKCSHPLVMRCAASYQNSTDIYFLLDLELGGELYTLMRRSGGNRLNLESTRFYAACLVSALAYFNSIHVAYRDVKPENLLLDWRGYLKIIDLGFARQVDGYCFTFCGTPDYMAPELLQARPHNQAVDWWALGVLVYEMLVGRPPFSAGKDSDETNEAIYARILSYSRRGVHARPPLPPCCFPATARIFISELLCPDPARRLPPDQCMTHVFFEGLDFLDLERRALTPPFEPSISHGEDTSNFDEFAFDAEENAEDEEDEDEEDGRDPNAEACDEGLQQLPGFVVCPDKNDPGLNSNGKKALMRMMRPHGERLGADGRDVGGGRRPSIRPSLVAPPNKARAGSIAGRERTRRPSLGPTVTALPRAQGKRGPL